MSAELKSLRNMFIATFCFSIMEVLVKSLSRIPTQQIVFFRAFIALVICLYFIRKLRLPLWGVNKKFLFLRGFFGTVALIAYFYTLKTLPLATAASIQKLSPLFTVFFAQYILSEKVKPMSWIFFILALCGALMIKGFDPRVSTIPFALGLFSAMGAGLAYNCIGRLKTTDHPITVIFYFPLVTVPIITPSTVVNWVAPTMNEWILLIGVGIVVQIAQYFMTLAYSGPSTSKVSIINYVGTVFSILFGYILFREHLNIYSGAGISLILFAVIANSLLRKS